MNTVQSLIQKKAALEKEMAEAIKQAELQKRNLEAQIERERQAQIQSALRAIAEILASHHLTQTEMIRALHSQTQKKDAQAKDEGTGMLSEIRRYYKTL